VPECSLSRRAASKLDEIRDRLPFIDGTAVPVVDDGAGRIRIWTFAGARANASIGQALPGSRASSDDFCIDIRSGDARSLIDTLSGLNPIALSQPLSEQMNRDLKFSQCLPAELASSIIAARILDKKGIQSTLSRKKVIIRDLA
jgi:ATP-dependent Lhr-like helicase